ncbi:MAG: TonB-dependent receptor [Cyclobacteriaceae bacterium]|nr:TonB-dependent receptor [Cyclobacteriaceae bacterium]
MKKVILFTLLMLPLSVIFAQTRVISGNVLADSVAIPGVSILLKGTLIGTSSDINGNYSLEIPDSSGLVLVFSFISYKKQEIAIGNRTIINVNLLSDYTELSEVVVTGYRSEIKADIIGSVSIVTAKDFENMPVIGMDQALQGQASGVQVTQSSGTPGGGISVKIRGSTSISAGNRPLFIVDGVPVQDGTLGLSSFGGQRDNALSALNPNDIESISILKDASTKAQYGSRAANGVILVTTKRGTGGKTQVNFDIQRGIIDVVKKVELLNASQLLELQREAVANAGENPNALGLIPGVTDAVDTDWLDEILRTGILEQYQLSMRGGSDQTRMYMSANYRDEEGVQLNNRFKRFAGTLNMDHKISKSLGIGINLSLSKIQNDRVKGDNFLDGVYSGALKSLPFYTPFDEQGKLIGPGSGQYAAFPNFNPVGQAILPRFQTEATKILGSVFVHYKINNNFTFNSKLSLDYNNVFEDQFEPSSTAIGGYLPSVGGAGYGVYITGIYSTVVQNNTLNYEKKIGKHNISVGGGTEIIQQKQRSSDVQGRLFPSDDFTYIVSAGIVDNGSSFIDQNGLASVFGDSKYTYNEKYLFSASMRADASSRFGKGRKVGYFPAASAGWRISSEPFMEKFEIIDELKLKAGFGFTGNERIGNYRYFGTWSASTYNGATGTAPAGVGNPNLQWENTREVNIGIDAAIYSGKVQINLDLYSNYTSNLLLNRLYPYTTGFGGVTGNIGNISNKGIELSLSTVNYDLQKFKWNTSLNLSRNSNKVVALADTLPIYRGYVGNGVSSTSIVKEGEPLSSFWGLQFLGVDPATGDAIYSDLNGDGKINDADATILGSAQPDIIGGITNSITYKNFDLNVFFQFSYGNEILNFSNTALLNAGEDIVTNQSILALDRWQEPGDITYLPRYELNNTKNNWHSSRFIEDGSYLRLKNVTLGYTVPPSFITKYRLNSLRAYISATNLWTLSNYSGADPEVSTLDGSTTAQGIDFFTLPQVRTIMMGIKFGL